MKKLISIILLTIFLLACEGVDARDNVTAFSKETAEYQINGVSITEFTPQANPKVVCVLAKWRSNGYTSGVALQCFRKVGTP